MDENQDDSTHKQGEKLRDKMKNGKVELNMKMYKAVTKDKSYMIVDCSYKAMKQ